MIEVRSCIVSKLCYSSIIKRILTDYFRLHRSEGVMKPKLRQIHMVRHLTVKERQGRQNGGKGD